MSPLICRIDELEGTALEQPDGLTWPQLQRLADCYAAWHGDTPQITAARRAALSGRSEA